MKKKQIRFVKSNNLFKDIFYTWSPCSRGGLSMSLNSKRSKLQVGNVVAALPKELGKECVHSVGTPAPVAVHVTLYTDYLLAGIKTNLKQYF